MILESATISVKPGTEAQFEQALERAKQVAVDTPGFVSLSLRRGLERPSVYKLLIEWETLEAHTVTFRQSERFVQWRGLIGEFFAEPPFVEHFDEVLVRA